MGEREKGAGSLRLEAWEWMLDIGCWMVDDGGWRLEASDWQKLTAKPALSRVEGDAKGA